MEKKRGLGTRLAPYTPSALVKNPVSGSLVVPLISPSVGVTVKENLSHTLGLEYVKMYSLASPHTESRATASVESRVVVLVSTQYSVEGTAFHTTVMMFRAARMSVMTVATEKCSCEKVLNPRPSRGHGLSLLVCLSISDFWHLALRLQHG